MQDHVAEDKPSWQAAAETSHTAYGGAIAQLVGLPNDLVFDTLYTEFTRLEFVPEGYQPEPGEIVADGFRSRPFSPPSARPTTTFTVRVRTTGRGDHSTEYKPVRVHPLHHDTAMSRHKGYVRRAGAGSVGVNYDRKTVFDDEVSRDAAVKPSIFDDPIDSLRLASPRLEDWAAVRLALFGEESDYAGDPLWGFTLTTRRWVTSESDGRVRLHEFIENPRYTQLGEPARIERVVVFDPSLDYLPVEVRIREGNKPGKPTSYRWSNDPDKAAAVRVGRFGLVGFTDVRPITLADTWRVSATAMFDVNSRRPIDPPDDAAELLEIPPTFLRTGYTKAEAETTARRRREMEAEREADPAAHAVSGGSTTRGTYLTAGVIVLALLGVVAASVWARR